MSTGTLDVLSWPARLGVKTGDTVQLMADLTRPAWNARRAGVRFEPTVFLDAFVNAVGPSGDVLVPTFNFDLRNGDAFDVMRTRSISGALAQAALDHPRFRRTPHALHSFAVAGAHQQELISAQEPGSFGPGSPFAFLHQHQGTLIAIDMPLNDALTFTHYVEERVGVPYRTHRTIRVQYTDSAGRTNVRPFTIYAKRPGHHMELSALRPLLEAAGAMDHGEIDGSRYLRVDLAKAYAVIAQEITADRARRIHFFRWTWWLRDHTKNLLRTFGIRTPAERTAHAARTA